MDVLLKTTAGLLVILNEDRQVVALNHAFLDELGLTDPEEALGLRLGECLSCVHANDRPNGCGTTESCLSCGAAIAMMTAINENREDERMCALLVDKKDAMSHICLMIKANPIEIDNNRWILIYAEDITQRHFWLNLERVFFHDINNILTAVFGNIELLGLRYPDNPETAAIRLGIERMIQEVSMQKAFSFRRQEGIKVNTGETPVTQIEQEVQAIINGHSATKKMDINQNWPKDSFVIKTDPLLASRVIGNMIINACEASDNGETITLETCITDSHIKWSVCNTAFIPDTLQKRIFQRHFSTKPGSGRGLGTYSMKLLGEHYLKGEVQFTSSKEHGTCFIFRLPQLH